MRWGIAARTYQSSIPTVHVHNLPDGPSVPCRPALPTNKPHKSCNRFQPHYPMTRRWLKDSSYSVQTYSLHGKDEVSTIPGYFLKYLPYSGCSTYHDFQYSPHRTRKCHIHHRVHRNGCLADNDTNVPYWYCSASSAPSPYASVPHLHSVLSTYYVREYLHPSVLKVARW